MFRLDITNSNSFPEGFDEAIAKVGELAEKGQIPTVAPVAILIISNGQLNPNESRRVDTAIFVGATAEEIGENLAGIIPSENQ